MSRASGAAANLALRRRLRTRSRPQCHDVRYRLTPPSPAPEPRFRRCLAVASVPAKAPAVSSIRPKSPNRPRQQRQTRYRDRRSRRLHPRTHLQPKPPPRQIPIDGNRPPGGPRVPSWEAFGRRPPERHANSHDRPASETLHHSSRSLPSTAMPAHAPEETIDRAGGLVGLLG